jgi:hypothetical protein
MEIPIMLIIFSVLSAIYIAIRSLVMLPFLNLGEKLGGLVPI